MSMLPFPLVLEELGRRGLEIGPRQTLSALDLADQTLAAGVTAVVAFDTSLTGASKLPTGGADVQLAPDQAMLIEEAQAYIRNQDGSNKIQVISGFISLEFSAQFAITIGSTPDSVFPFTFPGVASFFTLTTRTTPHIIHGYEATNTYGAVLAQFVLSNTDPTASHTYRRGLALAYRVLGGIDGTALKMLREREG